MGINQTTPIKIKPNASSFRPFKGVVDDKYANTQINETAFFMNLQAYASTDDWIFLSQNHNHNMVREGKYTIIAQMTKILGDNLELALQKVLQNKWQNSILKNHKQK